MANKLSLFSSFVVLKDTITMAAITFADDMDWMTAEQFSITESEHVERIIGCDVLIVDEVSMLSRDMLNTVEHFCRMIKGHPYHLVEYSLYFRYVSNALKWIMIFRQSVNDLDLENAHPNGQPTSKSVKLSQIDPWKKKKMIS